MKYGVKHSGTRAIIAAAMFFSGMAFAHEAAADANAIKYRQSVMKAVGGHMTGMAAVIKGEVPHKGDLKGHAAGMAALAQMAGHVFPAGSDKGADTTAKPEIWSKPAEFKKAMGAFQTAAANMNKAAQGTDSKAVGAAFAELGKSCKGCHDDFRAKK